MKAFINNFLKFLNMLALLVLLVSCLATYVEPTQIWHLSFAGFLFPVVLLVNFLFVVWWIFNKEWFAFLSLVAIGLCWKFILTTFAFNFNTTNAESGIKVMSWNVRNFELYNFRNIPDARGKMMDIIREENPDILCLQEFYNDNRVYPNISYIRDTLGYKYYHFTPSITMNSRPKTKWQKVMWKGEMMKRQWGIVTFSKFPIQHSGRIDFANSLVNDCHYTDLDVNGKQTRVYNVHFESVHLSEEDYALLDSLNGTNKVKWTMLKNVLRKMKIAYNKRAPQANAVVEDIADYEGVKILCGDFNDVPVSYTYSLLTENMTDAFVQKGKGFCATYASKFSIFRIDYILLDPRLIVNSHKTIRKALSDHYPVVVTFSPQ